MSHTKRRESQSAVPKLPRRDDAMLVDGRRRDGGIPSIVPARAAAPNVIPFAKPRAISELAAANPGAVQISPFQTPMRSPSTVAAEPTVKGRKFHEAPRMIGASLAGPSAPVAEAMTTVMTGPPEGALAPVMPPSHRVSTGWTPPAGVKPVAQARRSQPVAPVTAWPVEDRTIPLYRQDLVETQAPAPIKPVTTSRPAQMMAVASPEPVQPAEPAKQWAHYDALGLGAPKQTAKKAAQLLVSAYRMLGFAILTIIVIVLVGYITTTAFFYFSNTWVVPLAVSATDEKVVSQQSQLAEQQNARDRIADELNQAERAITVQQTFQAQFAKAIKSDLEGRKLALGRIQSLASAAASTRAAIKSQNSQYAASSRRRMSEEYAAGLIDRNAMLSGKFQLAQITSSNLSLAERQAEFETRAAELEAQTRSLDAILASSAEQATADTALSYEVLRIKQEFESSKLDLAKSVEARDTLKVALARQDKIVGSLKQSAYLRAINDKASVAFVPYANLSEVAKGKQLYGCKLGMVVCHHVGEVLEVLPGEVQFKHPHRDKMMRGQLVELRLDTEDAGAASDDVLFSGGKPLLL